MKHLKGIIVPNITPKKDGKLDLESLKRLLYFLINAKVKGIFILGTTGEFQYLTLEEKKQVITTALNLIDGQIPVFVGVSSKDIDETLELAEFAYEKKATAVVLAPMYYDDPEKIIDLVVNKTHPEILLYNNPKITDGTMIPLKLIEKHNYPKIIGIKDSSGNEKYFRELLYRRTNKYIVYDGSESFFELVIDFDQGMIAGSANVIPSLFVDLLNTRDPKLIEQIKKTKTGLYYNENHIKCLKQKLVEMKVIDSDEMFMK
ncbi:dihydrodipicolinate synthase family protein [Nanoarchaeota archaeon]